MIDPLDEMESKLRFIVSTDADHSMEVDTYDLLSLVEALNSARTALSQLAKCNLNESNCGSFDVANKRIRNIALPALTKITEIADDIQEATS